MAGRRLQAKTSAYAFWLQSESSCWISYWIDLSQLPFEDIIYLIKVRYWLFQSLYRLGVSVRRVSLQSCQTTTRPFALPLSFPMETITHGLRRILTPPACAALHN